MLKIIFKPSHIFLCANRMPTYAYVCICFDSIFSFGVVIFFLRISSSGILSVLTKDIKGQCATTDYYSVRMQVTLKQLFLFLKKIGSSFTIIKITIFRNEIHPWNLRYIAEENISKIHPFTLYILNLEFICVRHYNE